MNVWEKICIGTYAEHLPDGRGYALHVDVPELLAGERGGGHTPRQVARRAIYELRRQGVEGVIIAHPNGVPHLPLQVRS